MSKLIYGICINDCSRPAKIYGKHTKEYRLWHNVITRCFNEKEQTRHPTYKGCNVSDNFLNYSYFHDWCQQQIGFGKVDEKGRSWCLDKDILFTGNKLYSEDTCVFVPHEINLFFTDSQKARGEYPVGVYLEKTSGRYKAQCSVLNGKQQSLGRFSTPQEAFAAYKPFKEALCKELAMKWQSEIDPRLFNSMMNWVVKYEV